MSYMQAVCSLARRARSIVGLAAVSMIAACGLNAAEDSELSGAEVSPAQASSTIPLKVEVDWPSFLGRHDLVWEQLPRQWNEGAFLGNGQLGFMAYATLADNRFDFHLGRLDVTDHRKAPDRKTSFGVAGAGVMYDFPRLDIGRMALRPAGKIQGGTLRVDLWNAELTGEITTDLGALTFRAFTVYDRMVQIIEVTSTEVGKDGSAVPWRWEFLPGNPTSPRAQVNPEHADSKKYTPNPPPRLTKHNGVSVCVQELLAGGDYATAWLEKPAAKGRSSVLYISTANEVPASGRSAAVAAEEVSASAAVGLPALLSGHRKWWHNFYPHAFLSIPDTRLESFYWIQIYKMASATRPDGPVLDLLGPFSRISSWPGVWWNLNVQLTYWPAYAGNRLELGSNLLVEIDRHFDAMLRNWGDSTGLGDFAWALHNYWLQLRYAGDWKGVRERWTPKAKAVLNCYLSKLKADESGMLQLAPMLSPEYCGFKPYANANYNLALVRWLLISLIEADDKTRDEAAPDPSIDDWKKTLDKIRPFPVDANGLMIGSDQPVGMSHRHFSHLLALYPLFVLNPDSPEDRALTVKSVQHWHRIENGKRLAGYSYTGGASLYASLGMGNDAYAMLDRFIRGDTGVGTVTSTTMYVESDGKNPVIETPLSAASATTELLLQSWGGKIRVFPAVPESWKESSFHQLRTQGAFLVSASRENGRTAWVAVESKAGEPCILKVVDWSGLPELYGKRIPSVEETSAGEYRIDLRAGETILLRPQKSMGAAIVKPLAAAPADVNAYGVKRGKEIKNDQSWPERPVEPVRD